MNRNKDENKLLGLVLKSVSVVTTSKVSGDNVSWKGISIEGNKCRGRINKDTVIKYLKEWCAENDYVVLTGTATKKTRATASIYLPKEEDFLVLRAPSESDVVIKATMYVAKLLGVIEDE